VEECRKVNVEWGASLEEVHRQALIRHLKNFSGEVVDGTRGLTVLTFIPGWIQGVKAFARTGGIADLTAAKNDLLSLEEYDVLRSPVAQIGK